MDELSKFSTEDVLAEAEHRVAVLRADKQVDKWPEKLGPGGRGGPTDVNLSVKDCLHLGGTVHLNYACKGTGLACVTKTVDDDGMGHAYEACIDETTI
jgi:hypothetical protein